MVLKVMLSEAKNPPQNQTPKSFSFPLESILEHILEGHISHFLRAR